MKTCVVKRRIHTSESAAGTAITVNLPAGFGTAKACLVSYMTNSVTLNTFDSSQSEPIFGFGVAGPSGTGGAGNVYASMCISSRNKVATSVVRRAFSTTNRFIQAQSTGATSYYEITAVTFGTDTLTLSPVARTPETNVHLDCVFTVFTGDDITVGCGYSTMSQTNGGSRAFSSITFQPDFILFGYCGVGTASVSSTAENRIGLSAAQRTNNVSYATAFRQDGAVTTQATYTHQNTGAINLAISNTAGSVVSSTLTSFDANGWTITSGGQASNDVYLYFALKSASGDDIQLDQLSTSTATGTVFTKPTSPRGRPGAVFGTLVGATTSGTTANATPSSESYNVFAGTLGTSPLYDGIGTIQTNTAGTAVTGTSTFFLRLNPGDIIYDTTYTSIGTISSITSNTALTLSANASKTLAAGSAYVFTTYGQYTLSHGLRDGAAANTDIFQRASNSLNLTYSSTGTTSVLVDASLSNFDTRPGYEFNYGTANATARLGWVASFYDTDRNRRPTRLIV